MTVPPQAPPPAWRPDEIHRPAHRSTRPATVVVVVLAVLAGVVALVAGLVVAGLVLFSSDAPDTSSAVAGRGGPETLDRYQDIMRRGPGTCLDNLQEPVVTPCDRPHDAELFAVVQLDGEAFPGDEGVAFRGEERCRAEFGAYVGRSPEAASVGGVNVGPNEASWRDGNRDVACLLVPARPGGKLSGSKRGGG
jgi:hypothetical protein